MRRYPDPILVLIAAVVGLVVSVLVVAIVQIGGDDADSDGGGGSRASPVPDASYDAVPGPPWGVPVPTSTPTPTPGPTDAPEPATSEAEAVAVPEPGRPPEPPPEPAAGVAGTIFEGVKLTVYACECDGTGAYCPWGNAMAGGEQVHDGAVACGYAWPLGQRLRILGDPYGDVIYTCKDRGGGLAWLHVDKWVYSYCPGSEGRAWREQLPVYVTVELLN